MLKGLSCRFNLENGKFVLSGGTDKTKDNLLFLASFNYVTKVYDPDFNLGVSTLLQKPTSYLNTYKPLLLGLIKRVVLKYVPNIELLNIDIQYQLGSPERKYLLVINYKYKFSQNDAEETIVTFI